MRKCFCSAAFLLLSVCLFAQELFPNNEPASSVPKGVLGIKVFDETYQEVNLLRNMFALRLMYGVLPKLSVMATGTVSNHHGTEFPPNLVSHTHSGNQTTYSSGTFQRGIEYPYQFNGISLYAKYRFLTIDQEKKHFRMALYGQWSDVKVAHDETEPNLMDDTKGYGGGLITTYLINHLAISFTTGFIVPGQYNGLAPDIQGGINVGDIPTEVKYGKAFEYHLSFGYLLYPKKYDNYKQTNWNVYLEFMGKSYEAAVVHQAYTHLVPIQTPLLEAGSYVDVCPGVQAIVNSKLRIDFTTWLPLINKSYAHFYPVFMIGIQRYFFFHKKTA